MNLKDVLDRIELNKYEREAYLALYRLEEAKSREICKEGSIPYGRIYDVLMLLEQKGLISILDTYPKLFKMIEPKKGVLMLLNKQKDDLEKLKQELNGMEMPPKKLLVKANEDETIVVKGKDKMRQIKDVMEETAKNEMLTTHFGMADAREKALISKERMLGRGVKERLILSKLKKAAKLKIERCLKLGSKVKLFPLKGLRLLVKDRKEAIICIVDHKSNEYISVYTKNKDFAESIATLFDSVWEKGKTLEL